METSDHKPLLRRPLARFEPVRRDDLRPEMAALVGLVQTWRYAGTQDQGSYAGQHTWTIDDFNAPPFWVPDQDLVLVSG